MFFFLNFKSKSQQYFITHDSLYPGKHETWIALYERKIKIVPRCDKVVSMVEGNDKMSHLNHKMIIK